MHKNGNKKASVNNSYSYSLHPATADQQAKIVQLEEQAHILGNEVNQPYILGLTILTTTLMYSFLVLREDALFHEQYLKSLDYFFSQYLSPKLTFEYSVETNAIFQKNIAITKEHCLSYYEYARALNAVSGNAITVDSILTMRYGVSGLNDIRTNCLKFSEGVVAFLFKELKATVEQVEMIIGNSLDLRSLSLEQLFEVTAKLVQTANEEIPNVFNDYQEYGKKYARLMALEKQNSIINFSKIIMVTAFKNFILKPIANYAFPYGIILHTKPKFLPNKLLLTEKNANTHIHELDNHIKYSKYIAYRTTKFVNLTFAAMAILALFALSNFAFVDLPGELTFFLVATAASFMYQSLIFLKKAFDNYYLNTQMQKNKKILEIVFKDIFKIELIEAPLLELCQFKFKKATNLDIKSKNLMVMLSRCLRQYNIRIISETSNELIVAYHKAITLANATTVKKQLDNSIQHFKVIKDISSKLQKIQKIFSADTKVTCNKSFDEEGFPYADWYLYSNNIEYVSTLKDQLNAVNCYLLRNAESKNVIVIPYSDQLTEKKLDQFIHLLNSRKQKEIATSYFFCEDNSLPSPRLHKKNDDKDSSQKASNKNDLEEPNKTTTKQKNTELESLPAPYENARRINASFLPKGAHVWALFTTKREDFPEDDCYIKFENIFKVPTIVRSIDAEGLVHDARRSLPTDQRLKGKLLGLYGIYRVHDEKVVKIKVGKTEETVHIFSKVVLEHN